MLTILEIQQMTEQQICALDYSQFAQPNEIVRIAEELEQAYPGYARDLLAEPRRDGTFAKAAKKEKLSIPMLKFTLYLGSMTNGDATLREIAQKTYRKLAR